MHRWFRPDRAVVMMLQVILLRSGVGASIPLEAGLIARSRRSEFTAHAVRDWLGRIGVKTLYIEPGSPWENGYNESFNSKLRDEILNTEIFSTLKEAKVLIERWRHHPLCQPH